MAQTNAPDGVSEETATDAPPRSTGNGDTQAPTALGPLLDETDEKKAAKGVRKIWDDKDPEMAPRISRWKANDMRRSGVIGVHVIKADPNKNEYKVWAPPGSTRVPPTFNQAARLCRRLVANLLVDKPIPECTPGSASDTTDPDAAEFATRILQDIGSGARHNTLKLVRRALDKQQTYDSGFVREWVDPKGGGNRPKAVKASPAATHLSNAVWVDEAGGIPQPGPYVTRYVKPLLAQDPSIPQEPRGPDPTDPELTDDPKEADLEWLPALRGEVVTGKHLRFIPDSSNDIDDAEGVVMSCYKPLSFVREMVPDKLEGLTADELWALVKSRPGKTKELLPTHQRAKASSSSAGADQPPPDDSQVLLSWLYMVQGPTYPKGCYILVAGDDTLLHRQTWVATSATGLEEALELPIAQFGGFEEGQDEPYKYGLMHFLGPGNEIRGAALAGAIEHIDRFNRRKVFYSPDTLFQPKSGTAATGTYIPVQSGTQPRTEEVPEYPRIGLDILDRTSAEMSDESGLQPVAQGMADPSVQSGLHAQRIIEQVSVGLSDIKASTEDGLVRLWRIQLQLLRNFFSVPQLVRFRGDDQEYKEREWVGADLADTRDVRILPGTFTMLAPSAKLAVAEYMAKLGMIDPAQLKYLMAGNVGGLLGAQDDPALLRVRRQINRYLEGPPKTPPEVEQEVALQAQQPPPDIQPAPGMPPLPPPPSPLEVFYGTFLQDIFQPVPNDEDPTVAKVRWAELGRALCGTKHQRFPKEWRRGLETEYDIARRAAGMGTVAEAQQAQAAQAAQAQAEGQGEGAQPGAPAGAQQPAQPAGPPPMQAAGGAGAIPAAASPLAGEILPAPMTTGLAPAGGVPPAPAQPLTINIQPPPYGAKKIGLITRDPETGSSHIEIMEA